MNVTRATVRVNGTDLYHEVRGSGPVVLFISGMTGDAGHYADAAELLASEFTVVTYDRRGNSRSPRPPAWTTTSIDEQAADAAGLLDALGVAPAAVFGSSGGAIPTSLIGQTGRAFLGTARSLSYRSDMPSQAITPSSSPCSASAIIRSVIKKGALSPRCLSK